MIDLYQILGVERNASHAEIKAAYRKLAFKFHPDRNPGNVDAEEKFKEINEAYNILTDYEKKAQYDVLLNYNDFKAFDNEVFTNQNTYYTDVKYRRRSPHYHHRRTTAYKVPKPYFSTRENIVSTLWAFGFFILIGLLAAALVSYSVHKEEKEREQQYVLAKQIYDKAETAFQSQEYGKALALLKGLNYNQDLYLEARKLRQSIIKNLYDNGFTAYNAADYQRAAFYFQTIINSRIAYDAGLYARLAFSYEMLQNFEAAINLYKLVLKEEPASIEARNRIAFIYSEELHNYEEAINYYEKASDLVIEEYERTYGRGYALTVQPEKTPQTHYDLHCGLAKVCTALGLYNKSKAATKWAIFLRPEESLAYFLKGVNHYKAKEPLEACQAWNEAKKRGSKEAEEHANLYCR